MWFPFPHNTFWTKPFYGQSNFSTSDWGVLEVYFIPDICKQRKPPFYSHFWWSLYKEEWQLLKGSLREREFEKQHEKFYRSLQFEASNMISGMVIISTIIKVIIFVWFLQDGFEKRYEKLYRSLQYEAPWRHQFLIARSVFTNSIFSQGWQENWIQHGTCHKFDHGYTQQTNYVTEIAKTNFGSGSLTACVP